MAVLYSNFQFGTITNNPLAAVGTTLSSAELALLPVVAGADSMWIVLNPRALGGLPPEIVLVTAHTSAATSCTITRAQQATTAQTFPVGTEWAVGVTKSDLDSFFLKSGGSLSGELTFTDDGEGVTFFGGARVYKASAGSIVIKRPSGDADPVVEKADGSATYTIWHDGNDHPASAVSFTPYGSIAATDVQSAIEEVLNESGGGFLTLTTTSTSAVSVDSYAGNAAKYLIEVYTASARDYVELAAMRHGGTVMWTEAFALCSGASSLASYSLDESLGNMRLLVTPASASSTTFKIQRLNTE